MPRIVDNIERSLPPALRETLNVANHADFCVGYFYLRGWKQINSYIERWSGTNGECCRLLVGMQPTPFHAGERVRRTVFGEGQVTGVVPNGDDYTVTVMFGGWEEDAVGEVGEAGARVSTTRTDSKGVTTQFRRLDMQCKVCGYPINSSARICPNCHALTPLAKQDPDTPFFQLVASLALAGLWLHNRWKATQAEKIMTTIDRMYEAYDAGNYHQVVTLANTLAIPKKAPWDIDIPWEVEVRYSLVLGMAQLQLGDYKNARGNFLVHAVGQMETKAPARATALGFVLASETCVEEYMNTPGMSEHLMKVVKLGIECLTFAIRLVPDADFYARRAALYGELDDRDNAVLDVKRALEQDAHNAKAIGLAKLYLTSW